MTMIDELPKPVVDLMASGIVAEFATISQAGVVSGCTGGPSA